MVVDGTSSVLEGKAPSAAPTESHAVERAFIAIAASCARTAGVSTTVRSAEAQGYVRMGSCNAACVIISASTDALTLAAATVVAPEAVNIRTTAGSAVSAVEKAGVDQRCSGYAISSDVPTGGFAIDVATVGVPGAATMSTTVVFAVGVNCVLENALVTRYHASDATTVRPWQIVKCTCSSHADPECGVSFRRALAAFGVSWLGPARPASTRMRHGELSSCASTGDGASGAKLAVGHRSARMGRSHTTAGCVERIRYARMP